MEESSQLESCLASIASVATVNDVWLQSPDFNFTLFFLYNEMNTVVSTGIG